MQVPCHQTKNAPRIAPTTKMNPPVVVILSAPLLVVPVELALAPELEPEGELDVSEPVKVTLRLETEKD